MKRMLVSVVLLCLGTTLAVAAPKGGGGGGSALLIEAKYGTGAISPKDLNDQRGLMAWNSTTPTSGTFDKLTGYGATVGYRLFSFGSLLLSYETYSQTLGKTDVGSGVTVTDSINYDPLYVSLDVPIIDGDWILSARGGVGYVMKYEFHNKLEGALNEDITWKGTAMAYRIGVVFGYMFNSNIGLIADVNHEVVSADSLKSAKAHPSITINGSPITTDTDLLNLSSGKKSKMDLTGLRTALGLRIAF